MSHETFATVRRVRVRSRVALSRAPIVVDAREVENSHPGKVILRSWYDRNKNMFPANRWETYQPGKSYATDGYTIK